MSNTTSSVRFTINFFDKTITGTKASFNKAGKGEGAEYEELTAKMAAHPDFKLVIKEQEKKSTKAKRTYDGMDYSFIEAFLATQENSEVLVKEYNSVRATAKKAGIKEYPLTKKWFLKKFSTEETPFDMDAAREAIADYQIALAVSNAA